MSSLWVHPAAQGYACAQKLGLRPGVVKPFRDLLAAVTRGEKKKKRIFADPGLLMGSGHGSVAQYVAHIASGYTQYKKRIAAGGITVEFLISVGVADGFEQLLSDLEITNSVHRSVLSFHFQKYFSKCEVCVGIEEQNKRKRIRKRMRLLEEKEEEEEEEEEGEEEEEEEEEEKEEEKQEKEQGRRRRSRRRR